MNDIEKLPRPELREHAFRKYEPFIVRALTTASFVVDCFDFPTGGKKAVRQASVFVSRFNDAKLGWTRYKYSSDIPYDANLYEIQATELSNGSVIIENKGVIRTGCGVVLSSDHSTILRMCEQLMGGSMVGAGKVRVNETTYSQDQVFLQSLEAKFPDLAVGNPINGVIEVVKL